MHGSQNIRYLRKRCELGFQCNDPVTRAFCDILSPTNMSGVFLEDKRPYSSVSAFWCFFAPFMTSKDLDLIATKHKPNTKMLLEDFSYFDEHGLI